MEIPMTGWQPLNYDIGLTEIHKRGGDVNDNI